MCKAFSELFPIRPTARNARVLAGLALALGLSLSLAAQLPAPAPVVKLASSASRRGGKSVRLVLHFQVSPGFHINAHHPNSAYLIPTRLKLRPQQGQRLLGVGWPKAEQKKLSFAAKPLAVYSGNFPLIVRLHASRGATVHGELEYQACNDRLCEPPTHLDFSAQVR